VGKQKGGRSQFVNYQAPPPREEPPAPKSPHLPAAHPHLHTRPKRNDPFRWSPNSGT
jgi:hypothetical protein